MSMSITWAGLMVQCTQQALIWKYAMEVSKARSGSLSPSIMAHAMDLRPRNDPPLPKCAAGNLS